MCVCNRKGIDTAPATGKIGQIKSLFYIISKCNVTPIQREWYINSVTKDLCTLVSMILTFKHTMDWNKQSKQELVERTPRMHQGDIFTFDQE